MNIFKPAKILKNYQDLNINELISNGFTTILIDIDNTIDIPDSNVAANKEAYIFLDNLQKNGLKVILVSNNTKKRVLAFINNKDYDYFYFSFKPLPFIYKKIIKKYKLNKKEIVSLGDQLLTDCLGSNITGIYSIYTKPLINKDSIKTVINRKIERFIFKHILHEKV